MRVLIDVNIFEDVARKRQDWAESLAVLTRCRQKDIEGCVAAWTVAVFFYFRRRHLDERRARQETIRAMRGLRILSFTAEVTLAALSDDRFSGFEDAIQFHTAIQAGVEGIVTRNIKHFEVVADEIEVLSPSDFLARFLG